METKIETKDSIKQFIHDNRNVLIASGGIFSRRMPVGLYFRTY